MQDITLLGIEYLNVPSIEIPTISGGNASFVDTSDTTAVASDVTEGKYFYNASGVKTVGTNSSGSSSGTDTSDATLNSGSQMLSGVTAYSNGTKYTGTIVSRSSSDLTASGATVTVPAGNYAEQATKSVSSGTAGTPTATKGSVSNNAVSVTPSVTNTTGYITGDTKTGTAVTVSASELVSGNKTISESGNSIDVTNYATVSVASGSATTPATTISVTPSISVSSGGLITASASGSQSITPSVTAGYVSSGTAGTVTVSGSNTEQLTTLGATTYTPGTSDQTISSGTYLTGTQTISGDSDLVATNIKAGVSIFGVTGTYSSWTKVAEHTYSNITQTSTTAANIGTWDTGHSEIWTSNKILYLRIRDTAGKRSGYFYGTDVWFLNMNPKNESTAENASNGMLMNIWAVTSGGAYSHRYGYSTTGYGVYPNLIYKTGKIRFASRYNSTYSLTINGNYKIEAYLLDPAGGVSIFT